MISMLLAAAALAAPMGTSQAADGTTIAFTKLHPRGSGISLIQGSGSERTLTNHAGWRDSEPDWSPDGRRIAFTRSTDRNRSMHIYAMRADGSGVRRLTSGRFDGSAAWSPNGRWIAYTSMHGIRLVRSDGSGNHALRGTKAGASYPAWSPDGKRIAWTKPYALGREDTVVQKLDGSARRHLLYGREAAWSPDGRTLAFTGQDGGVFRMPAAGGKVRGLGKGMHPTWSGDGAQIAFARWPGGNSFSVWVMSANGTGSHALVRAALDPDWRR